MGTPDIGFDTAFLIAAVVSAFLVGLSKGGLPAIGSLGVPVLALAISPIRAAGLLLPIYVASDLVALWLYRREFDTRVISIVVPAGIAGVGFGWATASWMSEDLVTLIVGVIGIAFCLIRAFPRRLEPDPRPADVPRGLFWGAISGFVSFVSHSGAPPYQMYVLPLNQPKMIFAGTSTITFAIINWVKLIPYYALGQFSAANLRDAAFLIPVAIVGTVASAFVTRIVPDALFFRIVTIALFLISVKLTWDGGHGLIAAWHA